MMDEVDEEEVRDAEQLLLKQSRKRSDSPWLCDSKETLAEMEERQNKKMADLKEELKAEKEGKSIKKEE